MKSLSCEFAASHNLLYNASNKVNSILYDSKDITCDVNSSVRAIVIMSCLCCGLSIGVGNELKDTKLALHNVKFSRLN